MLTTIIGHCNRLWCDQTAISNLIMAKNNRLDRASNSIGVCGGREEGLLTREKRHLLLDYNEYEGDLRFDCGQVHRKMKKLSDRRPAARKAERRKLN